MRSGLQASSSISSLLAASSPACGLIVKDGSRQVGRHYPSPHPVHILLPLSASFQQPSPPHHWLGRIPSPQLQGSLGGCLTFSLEPSQPARMAAGIAAPSAVRFPCPRPQGMECSRQESVPGTDHHTPASCPWPYALQRNFRLHSWSYFWLLAGLLQLPTEI